MMKHSSSLSFLYVVLGVSLVWSVAAQTQAPTNYDCGSSALNSNVPKFSSLSVFPNPARVGQQVHLRTVVSLPVNIGMETGDIEDGMMSMDMKLDGDPSNSFTITGIPLCTASSAIVCSKIGPGDNAISFDYSVPTIPAGTYSVTLRISPNSANLTTKLADGCLTFSVDIIDPTASPDKFVSWIEAELAGVSQFEHADYMQRSLQEYVQIGPIGDIDANTAYSFPWGTFISLKGSGDLIEPYFAPGGYVWGLSGQMDEITYQGTTRDHVYTGTFYVGYVTSLAKRTLDVEILTGHFTLTWHITQTNGVIASSLAGSITFDDKADLPLGFSNPITVGRLGTAKVFTDQEGILTLTGAENVCLDDPDCNAPLYDSDSGDDLSSWQIGLITGVIVGVAMIFVVVIALWKWHRRTKRHEEEDGIFAARRKPEYGNALVVDDIIQETREHSPNILPPLYRRDAELSDSDSDEDFTRSRSRSRTPSRSPSPYSDRGRRTSKSPARARSRSGSRSNDSEDYTAGSSASRQ